jgi:hypothetical protein
MEAGEAFLVAVGAIVVHLGISAVLTRWPHLLHGRALPGKASGAPPDDPRFHVQHLSHRGAVDEGESPSTLGR